MNFVRHKNKKQIPANLQNTVNRRPRRFVTESNTNGYLVAMTTAEAENNYSLVLRFHASIIARLSSSVLICFFSTRMRGG
jgi:hypothetical protein